MGDGDVGTMMNRCSRGSWRGVRIDLSESRVSV
jgi:hypothetical protein